MKINEELKQLKEKGVGFIMLNGWLENIKYVETLHQYSLTRVSEGNYISNPK